MPRVDPEKAREFLRLSRQGFSYIKIGKKFGLNNKTVSLWVKKAEEYEKTMEVKAVGTDLSTRYTGEHHRMLLAASRGVHRAVSASLPSVGQGQEAEALLEHQVLTGLQDMEDLLAERGVHVRPGEPGDSRDGDLDLLETMAIRLRDGLFQHIPELREAVEMWTASWDEFRARQVEVVGQVAGALVQARRVEGDAAMELASSAVTMVLGSSVSAGAGEESSSAELDFAVSQIEPRLDAVREALGRVRSSAVDCKNLVADLLLWGGTTGKCNACSVDDKPI